MLTDIYMLPFTATATIERLPKDLQWNDTVLVCLMHNDTDKIIKYGKVNSFNWTNKTYYTIYGYAKVNVVEPIIQWIPITDGQPPKHLEPSRVVTVLMNDDTRYQNQIFNIQWNDKIIAYKLSEITSV